MSTNFYSYFNGDKYYIDRDQSYATYKPQKGERRFKPWDPLTVYDLKFISRPLTVSEKPKNLQDLEVRYDARVTLSRKDNRKRVLFVPFIAERGNKNFSARELESLPSQGKLNLLHKTPSHNSHEFREFFGFCDEIIMGLASTQDRPFYTTEAYLQKHYNEIMTPQNTEFDRSERNVDIYRFNNGNMIVKYNTNRRTICIQESERRTNVISASPIYTDDITIIPRDQINKLVKKLQQLKEEASSSR